MADEMACRIEVFFDAVRMKFCNLLMGPGCDVWKLFILPLIDCWP